MTLVLAFAFGAGLVSPLNPCGFGLLPAFLGYQLGGERRGDAALVTRLGRGLAAGGAVSVGFAGVLVSVALLVALGLRPLLHLVPAAGLAVGVLLVGAGVAVLAGRRVSAGRLARWGPLGRLGTVRPGSGGDTSRLVAFGAGYAVASVACTLAILLAVVGQALATGSFPAMVAVLAAYGAGAATLLTSLTVSTAVAGSVLSARLRRALPFSGPLAGTLLVLSGAYLVATRLGGVQNTGAVRTVTGWVDGASARASALVQSVYLWFIPVLVGLLLLAALLVLQLLLRRRRAARAADAPAAPCCEPGEVTADRTTV